MRNVLTIALAALGVATASMAFGQTQDPEALVPVNVSVRLGIGLPIDDNLRDYSSTFLNFGAEYRIDNSLLKGGDTYFAVDLFKGNRNDEGYVIPITINQRFYTRELSTGRRTYAFAGVGVAYVKGDNWNANFAFRGGLGAELGDRIFAEGGLTLTNSKDGISGNLIGLSVGYRF